jgi:hypothetical protein
MASARTCFAPARERIGSGRTGIVAGADIVSATVRPSSAMQGSLVPSTELWRPTHCHYATTRLPPRRRLQARNTAGGRAMSAGGQTLAEERPAATPVAVARAGVPRMVADELGR